MRQLTKAYNEQVKKSLFSVPIPAATDTYAPVSHEYIVDLIYQRITSKSGYKIIEERYGIGARGDQMVAEFVLDLPGSKQFPDHKMLIAFQNSYDKSMAIKFGAGIRDVINSYSIIVEEVSFYRKHTGTVKEEVNDIITKTGQKLVPACKDIEEMRNDLESVRIDGHWMAELLGEMFLKEELTGQQLKIAAKRYKERSNYHSVSANHGSMWGAYTDVLYALNVDHPTTRISKHIKMHDKFEDMRVNAQIKASVA